MKLTKRQLKQIIREEKQKLQEWGRPSDAMIRARNEEPSPEEAMRAGRARRQSQREEMVDLITDILMNGTGLVPATCEASAEEIVTQLQEAGYC